MRIRIVCQQWSSHFLAMRFEMCFEGVRVSVAFVTGEAGIGIQVFVDESMSFVVAMICERLIAVHAMIWFFPCMFSHVAL